MRMKILNIPSNTEGLQMGYSSQTMNSRQIPVFALKNK